MFLLHLKNTLLRFLQLRFQATVEINQVLRLGLNTRFTDLLAAELAYVGEVLLFKVALEVEVVAQELDLAVEIGHADVRVGVCWSDGGGPGELVAGEGLEIGVAVR